MSPYFEVPPENERLSLEENEKHILESQLDPGTSNAQFFAIYRFATSIDVVYIVGSTVACAAGGVSVPLMMVRSFVRYV